MLPPVIRPSGLITGTTLLRAIRTADPGGRVPVTGRGPRFPSRERSGLRYRETRACQGGLPACGGAGRRRPGELALGAGEADLRALDFGRGGWPGSPPGGVAGRGPAWRSEHLTQGIRCAMLWPDPAQCGRVTVIRDNLTARIAEAEREGWLGGTEGLQVGPAEPKRNARRSAGRSAAPLQSASACPNRVRPRVSLPRIPAGSAYGWFIRAPSGTAWSLDHGSENELASQPGGRSGAASGPGRRAGRDVRAPNAVDELRCTARQLPRACAPLPGETISSYLGRLAAANRIDPEALRIVVTGDHRKAARPRLAVLSQLSGYSQSTLLRCPA